MALLPDSPAINAGDNATCEATDQRGITRPQTSTCDIGAYEKRAPSFASTAVTSANVNAVYSYSITTTDNEPTDGASPAISTPTKPAWLTLTDNGNGTGTLTGTPTSAELGTHNVTLRLNAGTEDIDQIFTITVNKQDQTINFGSLSGKTYGDSPFTLNVTASSGLTVSFSATGNCTVSGNTVSLSGTGSCTITASQIGDPTYNPASDVSQSFNIAEPTTPIPSYKLTIEKPLGGTITGEGISCGSDCLQYFDRGTQVTLTATPVNTWIFDSWTGDCDNDGTIIITNDSTCSATFVKPYTLTLTTNGQGSIENCGTNCTQTHSNDETLQLSATPADGWQFSDWTGACDNEGNVTMSSDKACQANFIQIVTLTVALIGNGTVTGKDINCGDSCTTDYPINTSVALVAEPEMEWILDHFSEDCDSQGNVQMTSDKTCIVTFIADPNIPNNGDANNDGIPDSQQNHVVTIPDQVDGEYLTLEVEPTCSIDDAYTDLPGSQGEYEHSYQFPQGLMYFELGCAETDVTVYFHALQRAQNPILQKYGPTSPGDLTTLSWYTIPNVTYGIIMIDNQPVVTAIYQLIDGELGDNTGVDGRIIDPMGLVCNSAWNASYTR